MFFNEGVAIGHQSLHAVRDNSSLVSAACKLSLRSHCVISLRIEYLLQILLCRKSTHVSWHVGVMCPDTLGNKKNT